VEQFERVRSTGIRAITVAENDALAWVQVSSGDDDIVLTTALGKIARFHEDAVRPTGRHAAGVIGRRLALQGPPCLGMRLLHAGVPSRPFRAELAKRPRVRAHLGLRQCPRVHAKLVIVDGALAYLGSANWTGAGLGAKGTGRRNFELGVLSSDEGFLDDVQASVDWSWEIPAVMAPALAAAGVVLAAASPGGGDGPARPHPLAAGLLAGACLVAVVSATLPWWSAHRTAGGEDALAENRPALGLVRKLAPDAKVR